MKRHVARSCHNFAPLWQGSNAVLWDGWHLLIEPTIDARLELGEAQAKERLRVLRQGEHPVDGRVYRVSRVTGRLVGSRD